MGMTPGQTPGESEYCWGPGMFPHPAVDYDAGKSGFPNKSGVSPDDVNQPTLQGQLLHMLMYKRTDTGASDAPLVFEGSEALGNPDRYGPAPQPVQTSGETKPPTVYEEEEIGLKRQW